MFRAHAILVLWTVGYFFPVLCESSVPAKLQSDLSCHNYFLYEWLVKGKNDVKGFILYSVIAFPHGMQEKLFDLIREFDLRARLILQFRY